MDIYETVKVAVCGYNSIEIGRSECGNSIFAAHAGKFSGKQIIITAGIHARECYTALIALEQLARFNGARRSGGAYFVPLVNPDGALFFERGETFGREYLKRNRNLSREWKANADGVDLNCNFPANFGTGEQNTHSPGAHGYIGEYPLCAKESSALASFTERIMPAATVSYHCMGGELYWEFFQSGERRERDMAFASAVAKKVGVKRVDGDLHSAGGYKDYCVQKLGIPSVTIEVIHRGSHPFLPSGYAADIQRNADLPEYVLDQLL